MQYVYNSSDKEQIKTIINQIVSQLDGNFGSFNLANTATTTTVTNAKVNSQSKIILQPRNANAAGAAAFINTISNGSFVVGHASATTVRTFDYVIFNV